MTYGDLIKEMESRGIITDLIFHVEPEQEISDESYKALLSAMGTATKLNKQKASSKRSKKKN